MFDNSAFDTLNAELNEQLLLKVLREYEKKYFSDVEPISGLEVVAPGGNACCFDPARNVIKVHPYIAPFVKVCRLPILHELIHSALLRRDGDADAEEGERFKAEVKRLQDAGAYDGLY